MSIGISFDKPDSSTQSKDEYTDNAMYSLINDEIHANTSIEQTAERKNLYNTAKTLLPILGKVKKLTENIWYAETDNFDKAIWETKAGQSFSTDDLDSINPDTATGGLWDTIDLTGTAAADLEGLLEEYTNTYETINQGENHGE